MFVVAVEVEHITTQGHEKSFAQMSSACIQLVLDLEYSQTLQRPLTEVYLIRNSCESCNYILATVFSSCLSLQLCFRCIFHFLLVKSSAEMASKYKAVKIKV
jgi:hypothetical protein